MNTLKGLIFLLGCLAITASHAEQTDIEPLILGVHPYLAPAELIKRFTPLANYLASAINRPVKVRIGSTYEEHINAIGNGSIDIAYMGPVPYVRMVKKFGKKTLLARQVVNNDPYLKGEIIVRDDSPIKKLVDLKGKCFFFGDPNSTMSSIMPQMMLEKAGVTLDMLSSHKFLEGHKNVALGVLSGNCDAGSVKEEVYDEYRFKGLRSVSPLPRVADHLLVASSKLPKGLVKKLRAAILQINKLEEGGNIMKSIHPKMTSLVAAKDSDYNSLRDLLYRKRTP